MPCKQTLAHPTTFPPVTPSAPEVSRRRGRKLQKLPDFPSRPGGPAKPGVPAGRAPPKTHLGRFLGLRLWQEAEPSSGGRPGRRSLGSCFLGVPHHFRSGGDDQAREPRSRRQERGPRGAGEPQSERLGRSAARTSGG